MGPLEVDRCWFEGFDKAIEVAAGFTTDMRISQTMIVPAIDELHSKLNQATGTAGV